MKVQCYPLLHQFNVLFYLVLFPKQCTAIINDLYIYIINCNWAYARWQ
jgi:hypothetical protein